MKDWTFDDADWRALMGNPDQKPDPPDDDNTDIAVDAVRSAVDCLKYIMEHHRTPESDSTWIPALPAAAHILNAFVPKTKISQHTETLEFDTGEDA